MLLLYLDINIFILQKKETLQLNLWKWSRDDESSDQIWKYQHLVQVLFFLIGMYVYCGNLTGYINSRGPLVIVYSSS